MLKHEDALRLFNYDRDTGILTWKNPPEYSRFIHGSVVGHKINGYLRVKIYGMQLYVHRIAWLITHNDWPNGVIDHINGDRSDNRISNLRAVTNTQNSWNSKMRKNNSSGVKGVTFNSAANKWVGRIRVDGKRIHVGCFDDIEEAKIAMEDARIKYHGEFSSMGNIS